MISMTMDQHKLKFASLNCRGLKSSEVCVSDLFKEVDILALQEHWLRPSELYILSTLDENVLHCSVSPMENDEFLPGRPYGGVALLWHRRHEHAIFPVKTASNRMVAIRIRSCSGLILVIAVYMPVEYGDSTALDEYNMELGYLDGLLDIEDYNEVVILGDFNADLRKSGRFSRSLSSFLNNTNLLPVGLSDS